MIEEEYLNSTKNLTVICMKREYSDTIDFTRYIDEVIIIFAKQSLMN